MLEAGAAEPFVPGGWDTESLDATRDHLLGLAAGMTSFEHSFGRREDVDPVHHLVSTAAGWGGLPDSEATYVGVFPGLPVGQYELTVGDVPVDGFWSISVYNAAGYFEPNELGHYSVNDITAARNDDGTVTVRFGGLRAGRRELHPDHRGLELPGAPLPAAPRGARRHLALPEPHRDVRLTPAPFLGAARLLTRSRKRATLRGCPHPDVEQLLRGASLRVTRPRVAVLAAVQERPHASTDTIIEVVRARPRRGLAPGRLRRAARADHRGPAAPHPAVAARSRATSRASGTTTTTSCAARAAPSPTSTARSTRPPASRHPTTTASSSTRPRSCTGAPARSAPPARAPETRPPPTEYRHRRRRT